jgi:CrcB protein
MGPTSHERRRGSKRGHGRTQADVLAVIALGGVVGATARFKLAEAMPTHVGQFPWATFWTNTAGSFLLGYLLVLLLERFPPTRLVRPFLATGILGAFTTMSTYQVETALLVRDGRPGTAVVYSLGSLTVGLGGAYIGIIAGRRTPQRHHREQP